MLMHVISQQILVSCRHNKAFKGLEMRQFANDTPSLDLIKIYKWMEKQKMRIIHAFSPNKKNGQAILSSSLC